MLIPIILLGLCGSASSQVFREFDDYRLSYYGNFFVHPGIKLAGNSVIKSKRVNNKIFFRSRSKTKEWILSPSLSYFNHPGTISAYAIDYAIQRRKIHDKGYFRYRSLSAGYQARFNKGETWVIRNGGTPVRKKISGNVYSVMTYTSMVGFAPPHAGTLKAIYMGMNGHLLVAYNASVIPDISFEVGAVFNISRRR